MYAFNTNVSMQDMVQYDLPPFQQCARDSRLESIMYLYNAVNGVPTCAGEYLLQRVPRDHWNWTDQNQCVVSDCNVVHSIMGSHHYTNNLAAATGLGSPVRQIASARPITSPLIQLGHSTGH
jgi:beta-D-xylosidase 4